MIDTALAVYACVTAPLLGWAFYRTLPSRRHRHEEAGATEEAIRAALGQHGMHIKSIERVPRSASEAVMVQSQKVLGAVKDHDERNAMLWGDVSRHIASEKKDLEALMFSMKAVTEAMIEFRKGTAQPDTEEVIERFVNSLEYARDRFASTATQKRGIEGIISNIRKTHAAK